MNKKWYFLCLTCGQGWYCSRPEDLAHIMIETMHHAKETLHDSWWRTDAVSSIEHRS